MNRELLQQALDALRDYERLTGFGAAADAVEAALAAPQPEPATWQFRWTNPGNKPDVRPHDLEWREVVQTNSMHTIADAVTDLSAYRFDGKPVYEVRPLYAAPPAAPQPEPVAYTYDIASFREGDVRGRGWVPTISRKRPMHDWMMRNLTPLYAAPPAAPAPAVPLTDERLQKHAMRAGDCPPGSMVVLLSSLRRMLSAAPVVREPLTDDFIWLLWTRACEKPRLTRDLVCDFARAIEGGGK